jgi:RNA polymerase sigma-70 factor (ECF subfamily)
VLRTIRTGGVKSTFARVAREPKGITFNARLFTFLLRSCRRREVAEDLLEETWLRLVKHARRLRPDSRLGPWLFTVARHLYVSYVRSRVLEDSALASLIALWPRRPLSDGDGAAGAALVRHSLTREVTERGVDVPERTHRRRLKRCRRSGDG